MPCGLLLRGREHARHPSGRMHRLRMLRSDGRADFVLTADHAGRAIPRALSDLGLPESERLRHIALDIGIAAVTERLAAALDAVAVMQRYSRLVIDCNREFERRSLDPPAQRGDDDPRQYRAGSGTARGAPPRDFCPLLRGDRAPARRAPRRWPAHGARRDAQLHSDLQGGPAPRRGRRSLQPRRPRHPHAADPARVAAGGGRSRGRSSEAFLSSGAGMPCRFFSSN